MATSVTIHKKTPRKELLKSQNFPACSNFLFRNKNNLINFFSISVYHRCLKNLTLNIDKVITCLGLVFFHVRISNPKSFVLTALCEFGSRYEFNTEAAVVTLWGWTNSLSVVQVSTVTKTFRQSHDSYESCQRSTLCPGPKASGNYLCLVQQAKHSHAWGSSQGTWHLKRFLNLAEMYSPEGLSHYIFNSLILGKKNLQLRKG